MDKYFLVLILFLSLSCFSQDNTYYKDSVLNVKLQDSLYYVEPVATNSTVNYPPTIDTLPKPYIVNGVKYIPNLRVRPQVVKNKEPEPLYNYPQCGCYCPSENLGRIWNPYKK